MTNGSEVDMWVRSTICFRKTDGAWARRKRSGTHISGRIRELDLEA